jgi:hypothetical protein
MGVVMMIRQRLLQRVSPMENIEQLLDYAFRSLGTAYGAIAVYLIVLWGGRALAYNHVLFQIGTKFLRSEWTDRLLRYLANTERRSHTLRRSDDMRVEAEQLRREVL